MIITWKPLVVNLLISLGVGAASALFTMNNMKALYADLNLPPLSPPAWVFGIVWTILFFLMGISAYVVYTSDANSDRKLKPSHAPSPDNQTPSTGKRLFPRRKGESHDP